MLCSATYLDGFISDSDVTAYVNGSENLTSPFGGILSNIPVTSATLPERSGISSALNVGLGGMVSPMKVQVCFERRPIVDGWMEE